MTTHRWPGRYPRTGQNATSVDPLIEVDGSHQVFDDGTTPYTPLFVRNIWDEVAGSWSTEYSQSPDFSVPYTPIGTIVPKDERVQLGWQLVNWSDNGPLVPPPPGANHAEITVRSPDKGVVAINRDPGPVDPASDQLLYNNGRYELEDLTEIASFDWAAIEGTGTLRVVWYYVPVRGND